MKKSLFTIGFLLVLLICVRTVNAQETDYYQQQVTNIFSELDTTGLETGLLADASFPFRNLQLFDGNEKRSAGLTLQG